MNLQIIAIATATTTGLVEVLKKTGLPNRLVPLLSIFVGIGMACLFSQAFSWAIVGIGVTIGLTASGLYSGVKATVTPANTITE